MSATTAGALKTLIEAGGLGLAVYRDGAPSAPGPDGKPTATVPLPYVTLREAVAVFPDPGTAFDAIGATTRETAQVDLWQTWRNLDTLKPAEQYGLADSLVRLLHGAALPSAPRHVYGVTVTGRRRLIEADDNVVHDAITVQIRREQ